METRIIAAILTVLGFVISVLGQPDAEKIVSPHLLTELLAINGDIETKAKPKYLSPSDIVVSPDKGKLYVTQQTAKRVVRIDIATKTVDKTIQLPNEPTGIAVSKDGTTLYVTIGSNRWPQGYVCVVDPAAGRVTARIAAGSMSRSPVLAPFGNMLYVCNWFSNDVSVIDLAAMRQVTRIPVTREPYAAAITPDGATLVVTTSAPDQKATDTVAMACNVTLINTADWTMRARVPLPRGSHSLFAVCITADGKYALATHVIGRFTMLAQTPDNGWILSNNLAIIDIAAGKLTNDVSLDAASHGQANPWGVAFTGDNNFLCITHMGSGALTIIKFPELLAKAQSGSDLSHDLTALKSIESVLTAPTITVRSPQALAAIDNKMVIAGYLDDSLDVVTISGLTAATIERIGLGPKKPFNSQRQGEYNFSDASLCFGKWQSCFSCHPFSRPDGLTWILNNRNNTGKNTKSMVYAWWTPPSSWSGKLPAAGGPDGSIRNMITSVLFNTPTEKMAAPLDTFFMWMRPAMSPYLEKGMLSASARRGKAVFSREGCVRCHPAALYTDQKSHDGGVADARDPQKEWDTPSLIEAWRTKPYGHTGAFDKIQDIVQLRANSIGASNLSSQDLEDLIQYVLSL